MGIKARFIKNISLVSALASTNIYLLVPNLNIIEFEMGLNNFLLGILVGGYLLAYGLFSFIWGYTIDRFGLVRKSLLSISLLLASIATILSYYASDIIQLILARIFSGILIAAMIPAIYSMITDLFYAEERLSVITVWIIVSNVGSAVGYGISFLAEKFLSWRYAFILDFPILLLAAVVILKIDEPKRGFGEKTISELINMGISYDYHLTRKSLVRILKIRTNLFMATQIMFSSIAWGAFSVWLLQFLIIDFKMDKFVAIILLGSLLIFQIFSFVLARFIEKISNRNPLYEVNIASIGKLAQWIGLSIFLFSLTLIEFGYSNGLLSKIYITFSRILSHPITATAYIIAIAGNMLGYLSTPITGSILSKTNLPEERGVSMAIMSIFEIIGRGIGSILVGYLIDIISSRLLSLAIAFSFWGASSIIWFMSKKSYLYDLNKFRDILERRKRRMLEKF